MACDTGGIRMPECIAAFYFDFDWSNRAVWELDVPVEEWPLTTLEWHLDLPFWSTRPPLPLFDLRPARVLAEPASYPEHWARVQCAPVQYPLEVMWSTDRFCILDGIHRLARLKVEGCVHVRVRPIPRACIPAVRR